MKKQTVKIDFLSYLLLSVLLAALMLTIVSCDKQPTEPPTEMASFIFEAVLADGTVKTFDIVSDKATVGEALIEEGLISGEDGAYGLYVLTVCDEYHKYEEDGMYWSFYINGEYAMTGVDSTPLEDGAKYTLKAEK